MHHPALVTAPCAALAIPACTTLTCCGRVRGRSGPLFLWESEGGRPCPTAPFLAPCSTAAIAPCATRSHCAVHVPAKLHESFLFWAACITQDSKALCTTPATAPCPTLSYCAVCHRHHCAVHHKKLPKAFCFVSRVPPQPRRRLPL